MLNQCCSANKMGICMSGIYSVDSEFFPSPTARQQADSNQPCQVSQQGLS